MVIFTKAIIYMQNCIALFVTLYSSFWKVEYIRENRCVVVHLELPTFNSQEESHKEISKIAH